MRIGILGSGLMGGKLGSILARAGHELMFSYARRPAKLKRLAREAGGNARAGTPSEAAEGSDALLLSVHWSRMDDVLAQAGDLSGKVIVSCALQPPRRKSQLDLDGSRRPLAAFRLAGREIQAGRQPCRVPSRPDRDVLVGAPAI